MRRFGDTAATAFGDMAPASIEPEGIRLVWLDLNRIYAGTSLPVVLGRSPQATYIIDDNRVSRSHARIDWHGGTFQLVDLSYNGTYVRFDNDPEIISLRRGACTLHGSRRDRPRHAALRAGQPVRALRGDEVRRHAAADTLRVRAQVLAPMPVAVEPAYAHGSAPGTAIVLCNLGTPEAPTPQAVRRYLAEFLSDPRVVEIPRLVWLPILHGIVLRVRPARSARKYASIWTPEGSPLRVWTDKQAQLLSGYLGQRGHRVAVRAAMRYGEPSIAGALDAVKAAGADRILVLPLYPQYAASTTASIGDEVAAWLRRTRNVPELRFVKHYHDDAGYIGALAARVNEHWRLNGRADRLVLSFHGLPRRSLALGDPYHCECLKTGRLLAERLKVREDVRRRHLPEPLRQGRVAAALHRADAGRAGSRRHGKGRRVLPRLHRRLPRNPRGDRPGSAGRVPGGGGKEFRYVPCLNDQHEWIAALADVAIRHLQGWDTGPVDADALAVQLGRALAAGAPA